MLLTALLPASGRPDIRTSLALPSPPYRIDPRSVATEYRSVPGFAAPGTPHKINRSFYLRYFSETLTRTVLLPVPGSYTGAADSNIVTRQLVYRTSSSQHRIPGVS